MRDPPTPMGIQVIVYCSMNTDINDHVHIPVTTRTLNLVYQCTVFTLRSTEALRSLIAFVAGITRISPLKNPIAFITMRFN